jgi:alcohol dehydrogenase class IV
MDLATFAFPTTIHFGVGARHLLGEALVARGVHRPMVVTDRGLAGLAIHAELTASLQAAGLDPATYSGVEGDPVESQVIAGVAAYRDHGADAIVGFGGGASVDVAKAVGLMATHVGEVFDYVADAALPRTIEDRLPPFVAVPTTAGTGSEVGRASVISEDGTHRKRILFSPHLLAREVFADPELTMGLPPHITAATGMDALTHNVEAFLARDYNPMCDGIALEGVRLISAHLERAVRDGTDVDARSGMLMASIMGAVAFQKGLGLVHSCAHALGTALGVHHGLANGLMLDHALAFNVPVAADRLTRLAVAAGTSDVSPEGFLRWIRDLKRSVGIPGSLSHQGVEPANLDDLVSLAVADTCHLDNPRPVAKDDFRAIFETAL